MKNVTIRSEYGLSFNDGKRVVRYATLADAKSALLDYTSATLVSRTVSNWTPY